MTSESRADYGLIEELTSPSCGHVIVDNRLDYEPEPIYPDALWGNVKLIAEYPGFSIYRDDKYITITIVMNEPYNSNPHANTMNAMARAYDTLSILGDISLIETSTSGMLSVNLVSDQRHYCIYLACKQLMKAD